MTHTFLSEPTPAVLAMHAVHFRAIAGTSLPSKTRSLPCRHAVHFTATHPPHIRKDTPTTGKTCSALHSDDMHLTSGKTRTLLGKLGNGLGRDDMQLDIGKRRARNLRD